MRVIKTTYQQQVFNILEKRIVSGEMPPEQKIIEQEIALSLGVSRSPVREALIQLGQLGLVRKTQKERWVVSEISLQDVIELYDVRKMMEVFAAKEGCRKCPKKIDDELRIVVQQLTKMRNLEDPYELDVWRKNMIRFHELIILSSGNNKLHELFIWTMKRLRWTNQLTMSIPGRQKKSNTEHQNIYEAFIKKDLELLEKTVCDHIEIVKKNIKKMGADKGLFPQNTSNP